jgi:hypothetical protein
MEEVIRLKQASSYRSGKMLAAFAKIKMLRRNASSPPLPSETKGRCGYCGMPRGLSFIFRG